MLLPVGQRSDTDRLSDQLQAPSSWPSTTPSLGASPMKLPQGPQLLRECLGLTLPSRAVAGAAAEGQARPATAPRGAHDWAL